MDSKGANNSAYRAQKSTVNPLISRAADERLLAAARTDNEEMLLEIFEQGGFDINFQDGSVGHRYQNSIILLTILCVVLEIPVRPLILNHDTIATSISGSAALHNA